MRSKRLIIRADANTEIGSGHLMRCLALAQAWMDRGGKATLISACEGTDLRERILSEGLELIVLNSRYPEPGDLETSLDVLREHAGSWMVLDGYDFDSTYQCRVREVGHPLLVIDDSAHQERYLADMILNQNLHATRLVYGCSAETRMLLGPRYILLRREFLEYPPAAADDDGRESLTNVLVSLGGGDPKNVTARALEGAWRALPDGGEITVVVGPSNPNCGDLERVARSAPSRVRVTTQHGISDMASLLASADVAVVAGGSTCWEMLYMGIPMICIAIAENQKQVVASLVEQGAAIGLGWHEDVTSACIGDALGTLIGDGAEVQEMTQAGHRLVDGYGAARVSSLLAGSRLWLREAVHEDAKMLWTWANDIATRAASFNTEQISWSSHEIWFRKKLANPECRLFVAHDVEDHPVGQIRFDERGGTATVSVSVAPERRGEGFCAEMIDTACSRVLSNGWESGFVAFVKPSNMRSLRAFSRAGFLRDGEELIDGQEACRLRLTKERP